METKKLTLDDVRSLAPSVFTDHGAPEKTSARYVHIPTYQVIEDMDKLGWYVCDAKEIKARKRVGYQRHLVVFRNDDIFIKGDDGDNVFPQILLSNTHDGTGAFEFRAGLFRLICSNGLVISTQDFSNMKIRHMGYSFKELQSLISGIAEKMPLVVESMNRFREKQLTEEQKIEFALAAIGIRFGDDSVTVDPETILKANRKEDEGDDLWVVYNRVQEHLLNGSFGYTGIRGKVRKARPVKNFQQDVAINEKLFALAEQYV